MTGLLSHIGAASLMAVGFRTTTGRRKITSMSIFRRCLTFAVAAALMTAPAFAQEPAKIGPTMPNMPGTAAGQNGTSGAQSPADRNMMAGMAKMNQAMSGAPMTGDPDRDFVAMMMPHHQGAIDMAQIELQYGKDPTLRRMAKDIVAAQKKEIGEMQRWQEKTRSP